MKVKLLRTSGLNTSEIIALPAGVTGLYVIAFIDHLVKLHPGCLEVWNDGGNGDL